MVKNCKTLFLIFSLLISFSIGTSAQGFLKVNGKKIQNDVNKDFILRGMGFGGWMLQEGYMFHLGFLGQQYKIREKITQLIGKKQADIFYDKWLKYHTQETDIDSMASWGFNSIRLPMHFNLFTLPVNEEPVAGKNTWLPKGFEMVDELLKWCKKNKIYLILDLHAAPGGEGTDLPIADRHPDQLSLWQSQANQDKTVALWKKLAERYKNEPYIGGYDILNETNWGFTDSNDVHGQNEEKNIPLRNLFIRITKAIREVDKNHIIFLEGNGFANNYNGMFPLWDNNLVISFHKYANFSNKESIQKYLDYRDKYNVPLWLGESGENSNTWYTNNIRLVENNDIGWSWWQLKKMGINQPLEIKEPKDYNLFVQYCKDSLQLDSAKGQQILNALLNNIQIQNNIYHKDVTNAMFRQVHSTATLPFKPNIVSGNMIINAVDYDLGRNGFAYYDKDTGNYRYAAKVVHMEGNKGYTYRNDGVDIRNDENNEPYIFSIEDGEWLLYTTNVNEPGNYYLSFTTSGSDGIINVYDNGKLIEENIAVKASVDENNFIQSSSINIHLGKGTNKVKIYFKKGGFDFKSFHLDRK